MIGNIIRITGIQCNEMKSIFLSLFSSYKEECWARRRFFRGFLLKDSRSLTIPNSLSRLTPFQRLASIDFPCTIKFLWILSEMCWELPYFALTLSQRKLSFFVRRSRKIVTLFFRFSPSRSRGYDALNMYEANPCTIINCDKHFSLLFCWLRYVTDRKDERNG